MPKILQKSKRKVYLNEVVDYEVIDGDSLKATIDLGYGCYKSVTIRLDRLDTPELKSANPLEREAAKFVTSVSRKIMQICSDQMMMLESQELDLYGRAIGAIFFHKCHVELNSILINLKLARRYSGDKARESWKDEELKEIIDISHKFLMQLDTINPADTLNDWIAKSPYLAGYLDARMDGYPGMGC